MGNKLINIVNKEKFNKFNKKLKKANIKLLIIKIKTVHHHNQMKTFKLTLINMSFLQHFSWQKNKKKNTFYKKINNSKIKSKRPIKEYQITKIKFTLLTISYINPLLNIKKWLLLRMPDNIKKNMTIIFISVDIE